MIAPSDEHAEDLALPPAMGQGPEGSAWWRLEPHSHRMLASQPCPSCLSVRLPHRRSGAGVRACNTRCVGRGRR